MTSEGRKISKSLQNGFSLNDLQIRGFSPLDFKMFVLQSQYQTESNFSFESLKAAQNRLKNWQNIANLRWQIEGSKGEIPSLASKQIILEQINDNLDTPKALAKIDEIFGEILKANPEKLNHHNLQELLEFIDDLLGLNLIGSTPDIPEEIKKKIIERNAARAEKDWAKSDEIRDELLSKNIVLRDTPKKSFWEYK